MRELADSTGICATFSQAKDEAQHVEVCAGLHPCKECSDNPPRNKDHAQKPWRPNSAKISRCDKSEIYPTSTVMSKRVSEGRTCQVVRQHLSPGTDIRGRHLKDHVAQKEESLSQHMSNQVLICIYIYGNETRMKDTGVAKYLIRSHTPSERNASRG